MREAAVRIRRLPTQCGKRYELGTADSAMSQGGMGSATRAFRIRAKALHVGRLRYPAAQAQHAE